MFIWESEESISNAISMAGYNDGCALHWGCRQLLEDKRVRAARVLLFVCGFQAFVGQPFAY